MTAEDLATRLRVARIATMDPPAIGPMPDLDEVLVTDVGPSGLDRRTSRQPSWRIPLLAAAAVGALLIGITATLVAGGGRDAHPAAPRLISVTATGSASVPTTSSPATATSTDTHAPAPMPAMLGAGQVGARTDVPWGLVGDGWTVTLWANAPIPDRGTLVQQIFLIDPAGGRYAIASVRAGLLRMGDISGDHQRVVLVDWDSLPGSTLIIQVNLHTGVTSRMTLPAPQVSAEYTKPLGKALILDGPTNVSRVGLDGSAERTYQSAPASSRAGTTLSMPLYTPDGATLVFGTTAGLLVEGNDGSGAHPLARSLGQCAPVRWWTDGVVLAHCSNGQSGDRLWRIPLNSSAPMVLTAPPSGNGTDVGSSDAWVMDAGTLVAGEASCGGGSILRRLQAGGAAPEVSVLVSGQPVRPVVITGVTVHAAYFIVNISCNGYAGRALAQWNGSSGRGTVLFGASVGGGDVISAKTMSSLG